MKGGRKEEWRERWREREGRKEELLEFKKETLDFLL